VALLVRLSIGDEIVPSPFMMAVGALLVTAWYAGFRAAVLNTMLSTAFAAYFFWPQVVWGNPSVAIGVGRLALFAAGGIAVSGAVVAWRRTAELNAALRIEIAREERRGLEMTAVSDVLHALNARLNVAEAFPAVAVALRALTGCDRSSVTLFDEQHEWATVFALDQTRTNVRIGSRMRMVDSPVAANVLAGRPHLVPDLAAELDSPALQQLYKEGMRSLLSLPLHDSAHISGMLTLTWRNLGGSKLPELSLLGQIADAIALAVEKGQLFEQVRAGHERLESLSHRLLEVQEEERRHIARELHDEIGQGLTGLKLALDAVERLPVEAARIRLRELQKCVNDLLTRVRDLSLDLRPGMLDDLGLLPALLWLFGRYSSQTPVRVTIEHSGLDRRFPPKVETAAYRIVQEALTNVARHAGVAQVTVRAWADSTTVNVQIADQGAGFDPEQAATNGATSGLRGMRERSVLLGGHITIESAPGAGTRLSAELPINGRLEEHAHAYHDRAG
jgi:signal transduction histidine kinase